MAMFNPFRRASKPATTPEPAPLPAPLPLATAPPFQPLPIVAADSLDREVQRLWYDFHRTNPHATWTSFISHLSAGNTKLGEEIIKLERELATSTYAQPGREYRS